MPEPSDSHSNSTRSAETLRREVGVWGATPMGLGSIIGTGVFVSIGIAAGITGPAVVLAVVLAAALAICNALSSAQLAANHPVSGGTYEYGYRYLSPAWGFTAGWMFLCAKSASAATAALGFAGYLLHLLQWSETAWITPLAFCVVVLLTIVVLAGIRIANRFNVVIVTLTLACLAVFVATGWSTAFDRRELNFFPWFGESGDGGGSYGFQTLMHATALMFVAYTGYGRIATLGEEVVEPSKTIPRAIIVTLVVSAVLYLAVSVISVGTLGASALSQTIDNDAAPLEAVAREFPWSGASTVVAFGAVTAMAGVMLNLVLGLSRVLFAMGRRKDFPSVFARTGAVRPTPWVAVATMGVVVAGLTLAGSVKLTWTFSAFTVLIYYAITNLAALQLTKEERLYHPLFSWGGLFGCVFIAFWVDLPVWIGGVLLIALGLAWHRWVQRKLSR